MDFWSREMEQGLAPVTLCMDPALLPEVVCTPLRADSISTKGTLALGFEAQRRSSGFLVVPQQRPGRKLRNQALLSPWAPKAYLLWRDRTCLPSHVSWPVRLWPPGSVSSHRICFRKVWPPFLSQCLHLFPASPPRPPKKELEGRYWKADDRGRNNWIYGSGHPFVASLRDFNQSQFRFLLVFIISSVRL